MASSSSVASPSEPPADSTSASPPPSTMKSLLVHGFVSDFNDEEIMKEKIQSSQDATPIPTLQGDEMLIQVLACSLSPGDIIMLGGNAIFLHPKSFPFVPGMDVCGKILNPNGSTDFQINDVVVAANGISPQGGLAQYMAIKKSEAVHKPDNVNILEAAASSSAITARNAVLDHVKEGDRVLILGGSGGVGSAAIALPPLPHKRTFANH